MLFNSVIFLAIFLPTILAGFAIFSRINGQGTVIIFLILSSLFFYGWWRASYLAILVGSILFNYAGGILIKHTDQFRLNRKFVMAVLVGANLALLGYFKYLGFLTENLSVLFGTSIDVFSITLPLAISFFTFQQIAYIIDSYHGKTAEHSFIEYCFFVCFFPQLIAGPIVHHREIIPQLRKPNALKWSLQNFTLGLFVFVVGLFKKIVLADSISRYVGPVFSAAEKGVNLSFAEAWCGTLAYTFQIYFDFSAYSDMAIGLGLMLGIHLPLNFFSPYKAHSIIDFWRRWHITLSRFLRDYVYIPFGGNAFGFNRKLISIMATMLLGGLWHGAGWTFVIWGGLHGAFIIINHIWRRIRFEISGTATTRFVGWLLTFVCVIFAWVFFRAESLDGAILILHAMTGFNISTLDLSFPNQLFASQRAIFYILACAIISLLLPNLYQITQRYITVLNTNITNQQLKSGKDVGFRLNAAWGVITGILLVGCLMKLAGESEFLYFQF